MTLLNKVENDVVYNDVILHDVTLEKTLLLVPHAFSESRRIACILFIEVVPYLK